MPKIEIDESLIPKGYEVAFAGIPNSGDPVLALVCGTPAVCTWGSGEQVRIVLRPKPRKLKAIVFEVAGEATKIHERGSWYLNNLGEPTIRTGDCPLGGLYIPLTRREVYQGDGDATD